MISPSLLTEVLVIVQVQGKCLASLWIFITVSQVKHPVHYGDICIRIIVKIEKQQLCE